MSTYEHIWKHTHAHTLAPSLSSGWAANVCGPSTIPVRAVHRPRGTQGAHAKYAAWKAMMRKP
eukprot:610857-Pelagomonas_calceolata.AAC.2